MIKVRISEDALADLNDGFSFYEAQIQDLEIISLRASGQISSVSGFRPVFIPLVYRDYRRVLSRVFPFGIFYTIDEVGLVVWAVINLRRDPDWIRRRSSK